MEIPVYDNDDGSSEEGEREQEEVKEVCCNNYLYYKFIFIIQMFILVLWNVHS